MQIREKTSTMSAMGSAFVERFREACIIFRENQTPMRLRVIGLRLILAGQRPRHLSGGVSIERAHRDRAWQKGDAALLIAIALIFSGCAGIAGDSPRPGDEAGGAGGNTTAGGSAGGGGKGASGGSGGSNVGGGGMGGGSGSTGVGGSGGSTTGSGGSTTGSGGGTTGSGGSTTGSGGSTAGSGGNTGGSAGSTGGTAGARDGGAIVDSGGKGGTGGTGPVCDAQTGIATPVPDAPAQCTSGRRWTSGNGPTMSPGDICMGCHGFTIAGTVYPTLHETGYCYGINGGAQVIVTPLCGTPITLEVNSAGNFYYTGTVRSPFTAKVVVNGVERVMVTPQTYGDCNSCHTQNGLQGAPGRIIVP